MRGATFCVTSTQVLPSHRFDGICPAKASKIGSSLNAFTSKAEFNAIKSTYR